MWAVQDMRMLAPEERNVRLKKWSDKPMRWRMRACDWVQDLTAEERAEVRMTFGYVPTWMANSIDEHDVSVLELLRALAEVNEQNAASA